MNLNAIPVMDFKRHKEAAFQSTINLVNSLISDLDLRAKKVKAKKKVVV